MADVEPHPLPPGSTLRLRVEDPQRGVESSTWNFIGSKRYGDLYVSSRDMMGDLKLSVHESGITRMAWTEAGATSRMAPEADRALSKWTAVQSLSEGWALVMRLSIPDSALSPTLPPLPGRRRKPTISLPPAGPGQTIEVRALLGRPGSGEIIVEGHVFEVGRMLLGDGSRVLVTAWSHTMTEEAQRQLQDVRRQALADATGRATPRAFAWGREDVSGIPFLLDAGDPRAPEDRPTVFPRYDGPPEVVVHEASAQPTEPWHETP